ncbi:hypothetical protein VTP01DRAFT_503 [Rhizomucor pusillus]|uniref:mitochondrial 37S ribosomal protein mS38 n=1 Tax=Rhizomucor pusillus TaxID=4840 RepID=UPI003743BBBB
MFARRLVQSCSALVKPAICRRVTANVTRSASTLTTAADNALPAETGLPFTFSTHIVERHASPSVSEYMAKLRPFSAPPAPSADNGGMQLTSILRKRRLKMNKHKHKKLRKRTRALRRKLGK